MQTSESISLSNPLNLDEQSQDFNNFLASLPTEKGWWTSNVYKYDGFWFEDWQLKGVLRREQHFVPQDTDILLITVPKSGTTWLKGLMFTLVHRNQFPLNQQHPLLTQNPHHLVPFLENSNKFSNLVTLPSPRILSSHSPFISLKKSLHNSKCKIIYLCRDPKDTFTSYWHFVNNSRVNQKLDATLEEAFDRFCKGMNTRGPFWDHVLGYWELSHQQPDKIFFLKYEEMKAQPIHQLKCLAKFLECPFSEEEEASGMVEQILNLCSIDNMRNMEVNKSGMYVFLQNKAFFRKGEVGDWKNLLSVEMGDQLDNITQQKFQGSGLTL